MSKTFYQNGEYYHVYNRGVEKREIFVDKKDYERFLLILKEFNTPESIDIQRIRKMRKSKKDGSRTSILYDPLVYIREYCLMPNHFHLLIQQKQDGGISKFLQKVGTGYTHYFNTKNERSGVLFQGKTKSKHIDTDRYFKWLQSYIRLNPLDIHISKWRNIGVPNSKIKKAIAFLEQYDWVSGKNFKQYTSLISNWEPSTD